MNITFKKLTIHNFMSFSDSYVNLNTPGYTLIIGENNSKLDNTTSNGSGKSSILEAIMWCLTGETIRGTKGKDVLKQGEKEGFVKLSFSVDNDEYEIVRNIS